MGEIADMMLDGTLCEGCGEFLGNSGGFPSYCYECSRERNLAPPSEKVRCPICRKKVKAVGLADHQRDAHGGPR